MPENADALERVGKTRSGRQGYMTWRENKSLNPFTTDKDIIDNQVSIIEYENGVRASLHMNSNTGIPERRMYICGSNGTLRADVYTGDIEVRRIGFGSEIENHSTKGAGMHGGGDQVLAEELIATMPRGDETSTTFEDGLLAAVTCFAIDEAMDTGNVVALQPYWEKVDA